MVLGYMVAYLQAEAEGDDARAVLQRQAVAVLQCSEG